MFIVLLVTSLPAYALRLKIDPELIDPAKEPYQFEVKIEDAADLSAFQFDLLYDRTVMTIDKVELGAFVTDAEKDFYELPASINNNQGKLAYGAFSMDGTEGPSGDGILALITYTPLSSDAVGTLVFDDKRTFLIATQVDGALPRELEDARITPTCEITVSPGTNGTIIPSGDDGVLAVAKEEDQTFTISPEDHRYEIASVTINGNPLDAPVSSHTFENLTCDNNETYSIAASFTMKRFDITPGVSGEGGTISPAAPVTADYGSSRTFIITPQSTSPDQCYHITDVKVDGRSVGIVSSYTFENVTTNHTITASFAINSYTITPTWEPANSPGCGISPSDSANLICGSQTFDIIAADGYQTGDVLVNNSSVGAVASYTFSADNMAGRNEHTIHAKFVPPEFHTIGISVSDGGTTSPPPGPLKVAHGSDQTIIMVPDDCYRVPDVTVDDDSEGAVTSYKFSNVTVSHNIHADFEKITYTIKVDAGFGGGTDPPGDSSGNITAECGSSQNFTITPDDCYQIADVRIDGESVGAVDSYPFINIRDGHTIQAAFEKIPYTITATAGKNGTIRPSGDITVLCGEEQKFTITPNEGFPVQEVIINGEVITCEETEACEESEGKIEYTFNIRENGHRIHARFEGDDTITAIAAGSGGKIDPSGEVPMAEGEDQTFAITPGAPALLDVLIDGESVGPVTEYTFEIVREGHTIIAVFEEVTITANAEENGEIEPSGEVKVPFGQNQIFTITPDPCYQIADVRIGEGDSAVSVMNDVIITDPSGAGDYELKNVTQENMLSVIFERITIAGDINDDGSVDLSDAILTLKVICGIDIITPNEAETGGDGNSEMEITEKITRCADVGKDGKIGTEEAVYILKTLAYPEEDEGGQGISEPDDPENL